MGKQLTQEEFINKAKAVHGERYDYSKVVYTRTKDKVTIIVLYMVLFNKLREII